jgi:hypothetical protein
MNLSLAHAVPVISAVTVHCSTGDHSSPNGACWFAGDDALEALVAGLSIDVAMVIAFASTLIEPITTAIAAAGPRFALTARAGLRFKARLEVMSDPLVDSDGQPGWDVCWLSG